MSRCPHRNAIQYCPLYVAAHVAALAGKTCLDKTAMENGLCMVDRGRLNYDRAVERIRAADPRLVAQCEFGKMKHDFQQQRAANMRLNGVH